MAQVNKKIWTIGELLQWTQEYFKKKDIASSRLDAEVLLSFLLHKDRIYLYVHFDEPLQSEELTAFRELIKKRAARVPVAYITKHKEFMGITFAVNKDVLIPRPETELLVETAIKHLEKDAVIKFADIGTGSGAIAISLVKLRPKWQGVATDISAEALTVARENAIAQQVEDRLMFLQGDLLAPLAGVADATNLSAILANPPYIPYEQMADLEPEVQKYEPVLALTDNADGLSFYRRLVKNSAKFLTKGGFLACEIGIHQAKAIQELAEQDSNWGKVEILKDLAGIERVIILWKQE